MSPHWLFFPTQSTAAQYIYEVQTDRAFSRGTFSATKRQQDSTGTESGSLADQFAPFSTANQFERAGTNIIRVKVTNSDTSSSDYGSKTAIGNNLTSMTLSVGGNVFTAESVSMGGTDSRPRFDMTVSDGSAQTWWEDNNLDDTDNITITMTITF